MNRETAKTVALISDSPFERAAQSGDRKGDPIYVHAACEAVLGNFGSVEEAYYASIYLSIENIDGRLASACILRAVDNGLYDRRYLPSMVMALGSFPVTEMPADTLETLLNAARTAPIDEQDREWVIARLELYLRKRKSN